MKSTRVTLALCGALCAALPTHAQGDVGQAVFGPIGPAELLRRVVAWNTRSPAKERYVLEDAAAWLRGKGAYAYVHEASPHHGNLVARTHEPPDPRPPLILHATVDTLACPENGPHGFMETLAHKEGSYWGCGVAGEKTVLAVMLAAFLDALEHASTLSHPVYLVVTADGHARSPAGVDHLLEVLPNIAERAWVLGQGGFTGPSGVAVQVGALQQVQFNLVARAEGAPWPLGSSHAQAVERMLAAAMRVQAHNFEPLPGPLAQAAQDALPHTAAVWSTRCRINRVDVADPALFAQDKAQLGVRCVLAEGEEPSRLAWRMVDVVKDPRVTVEWDKPAALPAPIPLAANVRAQLASEWGVPVFALPGPANVAVESWQRHGVAWMGAPLLDVPDDVWATAGTRHDHVSVEAFDAAHRRTLSVVRRLSTSAW